MIPPAPPELIIITMARAAKLCQEHHRPLEPWTLWPGWMTHIGCLECAWHGPMAFCWGRAKCHGRENGCGCYICFREMLDEYGVEYADHTDIGEPRIYQPKPLALSPPTSE